MQDYSDELEAMQDYSDVLEACIQQSDKQAAQLIHLYFI
jgi:hypothetical protein